MRTRPSVMHLALAVVDVTAYVAPLSFILEFLHNVLNTALTLTQPHTRTCAQTYQCIRYTRTYIYKQGWGKWIPWGVALKLMYRRQKM